MTTKVAINGFGRIGRLTFRAALESGRDDLEFVAINDLSDAAEMAYLLKWDSVHRQLPMDVSVEGEDTLVVGGKRVRLLTQPDPTKLPWGELGVDVVMECTGRFTKKDSAGQHLAAGAKKVLISAPCGDADRTIVYGVNHDGLTAEDTVVSNASCTTNCLAPVVHVLHEAIGIERGYMTTCHAYTGDQRIVDTSHSDWRRARAAGLSMIPTSTGLRARSGWCCLTCRASWTAAPSGCRPQTSPWSISPSMPPAIQRRRKSTAPFPQPLRPGRSRDSRHQR